MEPLAAVVKHSAADLVVLQEATQPAVVERLAAATGMKAWSARPGHSVAFMSRVDVAHHEWHLPRPADRGSTRASRAFLVGAVGCRRG